jgi:5-methyltetrahydropteroyltriglutamate--homocysteine methyltransferase
MDGRFGLTTGYPRIGEKRELKKATETYWRGEATIEELRTLGGGSGSHWLAQKGSGISQPSNDFSFYDHAARATCLLDSIPPRFHGEATELDLSFRIARGLGGGWLRHRQHESGSAGVLPVK